MLGQEHLNVFDVASIGNFPGKSLTDLFVSGVLSVNNSPGIFVTERGWGYGLWGLDRVGGDDDNTSVWRYGGGIIQLKDIFRTPKHPAV